MKLENWYQHLQTKIPKLKNLSLQNFLMIVLSLCLSLVWAQSSGNASPQNSADTHPEDLSSVIDTQIPAGFVLIPIEVQNSDSLDSIFGNYGVVNLYQADPQKAGKSVLVASKIKMLRAPQNPNRFAVLAKESDANQLLSFSNPFGVIVLNPKESGTDIVKPESPLHKKSRIQYFAGDET